MDIPFFKYHPDPIATGSVVPSIAQCACCGNSRGYLYTSSIYCTDDIEGICPWCIADGSAAEKFHATFVDDTLLLQAGLDATIVLEVTTRTPGYDSWQGEVWLSHCEDACAFLGDASKEEVTAIVREGIQITGAEGFEDEAMKAIAQSYRPKGSPAVYKFQCLHCQKTLYAMDYD
jgi:uncharacterized protein